MIVTFKQDGQDDRVWTGFKPDRLLTTEGEAIEKVTDLTFAEWCAALLRGSAAASRALVWVWLKRTDPTLRYRDVDFPMSDLVLDFEPEEKARMRAEVDANTDLSDTERKQVLAAIGADPDDLSTAGNHAVELDGPGNGPAAGSGSGSASG